MEWQYEDQLPPMTDEEYKAAFPTSRVIDGVRMFPMSHNTGFISERAVCEAPISAINDWNEMMDKLNDPKGWDIPGLLADKAEQLLIDGNGTAAACIDRLLWSIQKVDQLIRTGPVINAQTLGEAQLITAAFALKS